MLNIKHLWNYKFNWLATFETVLTIKLMTKDEAWDILLVKRENYLQKWYDFFDAKLFFW